MAQGTLSWNRTASDVLPSERSVSVLLEAGLGATGLVVLASYLGLALAHLTDRFQLNFVSGIYAGLALHLNQGVLYPDLYDGVHYGGTRYMPLHFALHAGLARLTGEYLVSGKLLTLASTLALVVVLFRILRRLQVSPGASLALISLVPASGVGFTACTTIRGDLLPVVLQLAALALVAESRSPRRAALAGILCVLAFLAKLTAVWGPLAIACHYLASSRRNLAVFLAAWLGLLVLAVAGLHFGTGGRLLANMGALSVAGVGGKGILLAPLLFLWRLGRAGVLMTLLVPLLLAEGALAVRQRRWTIYHSGLAYLLPILLVIYTDLGADTNHLLDLVVLAVPVAGCLWASLPSVSRPMGGLRGALALVVCWVLYMAWVDTMIFPVLNVVRALREGPSPWASRGAPLAGLVGDEENILSEDPWVLVSRGRLPVVLDPFAVARLAQSRPHLTHDLESAVRQEKFDRLVLLQRYEDVNPNDRVPWSERHWGPALVKAMREHYVLQAHADGYFVYGPGGRPAGEEGGTTRARQP